MRTVRIGFVIVILLSAWAGAQVTEVHAKPLTDEDLKLMRQDLQTQKNQIISNTMGFTTAENTAFWPVYKDYAAEQHAIADKRFKLIMDYVNKIENMNDTQARELTERMFAIEDETQALRKKYYPKFVQALGAKRAAKFFQVDSRLSMMINVQLASQVPLIP